MGKILPYHAHNVKRKKYVHNQHCTADFLGDHLGLDKYDDKYDARNINEIRHILNNHSNSASQFELGLRSYGEKRKQIQVKKKLMEKEVTKEINVI